jgi:hypothetical protein
MYATRKNGAKVVIELLCVSRRHLSDMVASRKINDKPEKKKIFGYDLFFPCDFDESTSHQIDDDELQRRWRRSSTSGDHRIA